MTASVRELGKRIAGGVLTYGGGSKYAFPNAIFLLAHMRCGSTALANILCTHPDVSGYGEAHVTYDGRPALGRLAINQMRLGEWNPKARFLFDKILHSRHDREAPEAFFSARAIFVLREPEPTIRSICKLFRAKGKLQYNSHADAARYYAERVNALARLWDRFPAERRIGLSHRALLRDPGAALAAISRQLEFEPPLSNHYHSPAASRRGGGGDPLESGRHDKIVSALLCPAGDLAELGLPQALALACADAFAGMLGRIAHDWPALAAP